MAYRYHPVTSLAGGLNLRQDPSLIADNECVEATNLDFTARIGSIKTRQKIKKLNSAALTGKVINLYRYIKSTGTSYLMAETDDGVTRRIYYSTDNGATFTLLTTRTTGYKSAFVDYEDWLYFADINDEPKRWDGSSLTKWGIAAPGTAPTLAVGAAGNPSGTYKYKVTFLNAEGTESANSPASSEITVSSQQIDLSDIPTSSDGQVTQRKIYRFGGTLTDYYYIATINDNTTTTYTDNTADTAVGGLLDPYDRYPAPNTKCLALHFNRIFTGNMAYAGVKYPHGFTWSRARRPENFYDPSNPNPVGTKGKEIQRVEELGESLYFLTEESIFALRGGTEDTFYLDPTYVQMPCESGDSVCKIGSNIGYLGLDGYYRFDGLTSKKATDKVEPIFLEDLNTAQITKVASAYDQKKNRIYIIYPEGSATDPNKILIYEVSTGAFHKWDLAATAIYFDHERNYILIGDTSGYVYELESASPTETSVTFRWLSKAYDFGVPEIYKTIFSVKTSINTNGQDITANFYADGSLITSVTVNSVADWIDLGIQGGISGINFQIELTGTVSSDIVIAAPIVFKYKVTDVKVTAVGTIAVITPSNYILDASAIQTQINNKQPLDATLTSISALGTVADKTLYTTGVDTWAETALTAFGRSLIDDADAATARATLGAIGASDTVTLTNKTLIDASTYFADDLDNTKKLQLQLSGITTATTRTLTIQDISGTIYVSGGIDVAVADGGTGASDAATARTNLDVPGLNSANTFGAYNQTFDTNTLFVDAVNHRVGIGTTTIGNILTIQQASATDPIADSWTVYSTEKTKNIINQVVDYTPLINMLKATPVHKWTRKLTQPVITDFKDVIETITDEKGKTTTKITKTAKEQYDIAMADFQKKNISPKFTQPKYSLVAEEAPDFIKSYDGEGNLAGIDLLAYVGWLHACIRGLAEKIV
jgi:hypothetical protein